MSAEELRTSAPGAQQSGKGAMHTLRLSFALTVSLLPFIADGQNGDELPTTFHQTIGIFQNVCDAGHGFKTFSKQVWCIKSLIARSGDYASQPEVKLYVLTADKLVEDVSAGRLSPAAGRVELQKTYMDVLERERAQAAREANERATAEQESQRAIGAEQERLAAARLHEQQQAGALQAREQAQAQWEQAVRQCTQHMLALLPRVPHGLGFGGEMQWMGTAAQACKHDPAAADRLQQQLDLGISTR